MPSCPRPDAGLGAPPVSSRPEHSHHCRRHVVVRDEPHAGSASNRRVGADGGDVGLGQLRDRPPGSARRTRRRREGPTLRRCRRRSPPGRRRLPGASAVAARAAVRARREAPHAVTAAQASEPWPARRAAATNRWILIPWKQVWWACHDKCQDARICYAWSASPIQRSAVWCGDAIWTASSRARALGVRRLGPVRTIRSSGWLVVAPRDSARMGCTV